MPRGNQDDLMRVVFDTNVLVSILIKRGKPRTLFRKAIVRDFVLLTSNQIIREFKNVIKRPKFRRYVTVSDANEFIEILIKVSELIEIKSKFNVIKEDSKDNIILNCAYDGKADYIVSGDRHLKNLKQFKDIKIISVSKALKLFCMQGVGFEPT